MEKDEIIAGLDIGTTKIAVVVGREDEYGNVNIIGMGTAPSQGLRRGVVINIEKTVNSIKSAVEQAELMCGHKISKVYAGIAGDHIRSINSKGVVGVKSEDRIITQKDVERALEAATAIALPVEREILHVLPQEYIVDNQDGIKNPVQMAGVRLEAEVHIVTAAVASAQNIIKCIDAAGLQVADIVLEPYASSLAVLQNDEKELGVCIMDIGGGTTDIAIFFDGSIRFTSVLGLGGQHVTADLSKGLRTSMEQAEEIKKRYGIAMQSLMEQDDLVRVPGVGGRAPREISRSVISAIIQPRMEEMFQLALREMEKSNILDFVSAGVVLTGGASLLEGTAELAEQVMGVPVKIGLPLVKGGLEETVRSPIYATGVGLIYYALLHGEQDHDEDPRTFGWIITRLKEIFENLFS